MQSNCLVNYTSDLVHFISVIQLGVRENEAHNLIRAVCNHCLNNWDHLKHLFTVLCWPEQIE